MANITETLRIIIDADSKGAERAFGKVGDDAARQLGKAEKSTDRLAAKATVYGTAIATAGAVAAVGFYKLAQASEEAELQSRKLDNSISGSGQTFTDSGNKLRDLAGALQQKTAADGDAIIGAESLLVQFGLTEDQILSLTPLIVDLSRKMGVDLDTAAKSVAKATTGNTTALRKMGVQVDATKAKVDPFTATLDAVTKAAGGFATQEGKTFNGQLEILRNNLGDLGESVGKGAVSVFSGLAGGAASAARGLNDVNPAILESVGAIGSIASIAGIAGGGVLALGGQVTKLRNIVAPVGEDGQRSFTKLGKAASSIAIVGAIAATIEAVASLANTINDIERKTAKASDELRASIVKGPDAAAESFGKLLELSDKSAEFSGIWEGFGAEVQFGDAKVDIEEFNDAFDNLLDSAGPAAAQTVVDGLRRQNAALDENSGQYQENARAIADAQSRIDARTKATVAATRAERDQKKAVAEQTKELDIQNGSVEGATELLKDYTDKLKLVALEYDSAQTGAKAFADQIERSTALDDQTSAANKAGTEYGKLGTIIKDLPRDLDLAQLAFGGLTDAQRDATNSLLSTGDAISGFLQSLIAGGASPEFIRVTAAKYRDEIAAQLSTQGINPQKYLEAMGLTEVQIDAAIAFSVSEKERQKLTTLTTVIGDQLPPAVLGVVIDNIGAEKFAEANAAIALWRAQQEGNLTAVNFILGAYPNLAPVLAGLQSEANQNPVRIPSEVVPPKGDTGRNSSGGTSGNRRDPRSGRRTPREAPSPPSASIPPGRAVGGQVLAGQMYEVNETGRREMFVPKTNGFVLSAQDSQRLLADVTQLVASGGSSSPVSIGTMNIQGDRPRETASEVVRKLRSTAYLMGR
jgi:hypothetical protein